MTDKVIKLAHGAGGSASRQLMDEVIYPAVGNSILGVMHDGARLPLTGEVVFTTDSYVVQPRFFRGGSIGKLAVCGTVNDLAVSGAVPRYLSLALILEEGLEIAELKKVLADIRAAAELAGVAIVTGDTKVVGRGAGDGIYINTAGVGERIAGTDIAPANVRAGMDIIVSGTLGDHAATVLAERHGLTLPEDIQSDCAPLNGLVAEMLRAAPHIAVLRDATRGGVAAVLNELAGQAGVSMLLDEEAMPVREAVAGVCEILGLEPLYLANEGKLVAVTAPEDTAAVLAAMREHPLGRDACVIGRTETGRPQVAMETALGGIRVVPMPAGELVPRIC